MLLKFFSALFLCCATLGFAETPAAPPVENKAAPAVAPAAAPAVTPATPAPAPAAAPVAAPAPSPIVISGFPMPANTPRPLRIGVAFILNQIEKTNESDGTLTANFDLTLSWKDPSLAFNPNEFGTFRREINLEQANKVLAKIWNPDVSFANMKGAPISREPCLLIDADGSVIYIQRIRATFNSKYNLAPFPFDKQHLKIELVSNRYNNSEVEFFQTQEQINHSGTREGFTMPGWYFKGISYTAGNTRGLDGKFFPKFEITLNMTRRPISHLFAFAPLILIVVVPSILTLYADAGIGERLSTWSGAILALIALSFTMQLRYPALPANSILNQLIGTIFAYEFFMICISMTMLNPDITKNIKNPYLIPQMVNCMRWQTPIAFASIVIVSLLITLVNA